MADANKADTIILPSREAVTGPFAGENTFKELWEERRGPVKSLNEAGLTKIVIAWQDRNGVMRDGRATVSHETCEAVIGLLNDEQVG